MGWLRDAVAGIFGRGRRRRRNRERERDNVVQPQPEPEPELTEEQLWDAAIDKIGGRREDGGGTLD